MSKGKDGRTKQPPAKKRPHPKRQDRQEKRVEEGILSTRPKPKPSETDKKK